MYSVKTITAENTFTEAIAVFGQFNISVSGTFVGTVTLQRQFPGETAWHDVNAWTAPVEAWDTEPATRDRSAVPSIVQYQLGFKAGDYTSGSAKCRVGGP